MSVSAQIESGDVLRISGDLIPEIDSPLDALLERGKKERVKILDGTEMAPKHWLARIFRTKRTPYARTQVKITFNDESNLRKCVRLLRWSDERLRARPDQLMLWTWEVTFREGMDIQFGVAWHDKEFPDYPDGSAKLSPSR